MKWVSSRNIRGSGIPFKSNYTLKLLNTQRTLARLTPGGEIDPETTDWPRRRELLAPAAHLHVECRREARRAAPKNTTDNLCCGQGSCSKSTFALISHQENEPSAIYGGIYIHSSNVNRSNQELKDNFKVLVESRLIYRKEATCLEILFANEITNFKINHVSRVCRNINWISETYATWSSQLRGGLA